MKHHAQVLTADFPQETLRQARARFFRESGFAADGGYDEDWSDAEIGGLRYRVRNGPARRAALRLHDLHHVATGYGVDWRGEAEISAWEIGGGLGRASYAWVIALWGLFSGLMTVPAATLYAFVRGRASRSNLYRLGLEEAMLDRPASETLARIGAARRRRTGEGPWEASVAASRRLIDLGAFGAWSTLALIFGAISLIPTALFVARSAAVALIREACPVGGCPLRLGAAL